MNKKTAFTLIEILIVIAIIAIITSVIVVIISSSRKKVNNTKIESDLAMIKNALEMYYKETGTLPLSENWCKISNETSGCLSELVTKGYMVNLPLGPQGKCPSGVVGESDKNKCYYYLNSADQNFISISGIKTPQAFGSFADGPGCSIPQNNIERYCDGFRK